MFRLTAHSSILDCMFEAADSLHPGRIGLVAIDKT